MLVVVVLPCVPATATLRPSERMRARAAARGTTGTERRRASRSSGFVEGIAVEITTCSASPICSAAWPMYTVTPISSSLLVYDDSLRSEPVILCPLLCNTSAMPLIPAPPIPTMWILMLLSLSYLLPQQRSPKHLPRRLRLRVAGRLPRRRLSAWLAFSCCWRGSPGVARRPAAPRRGRVRFCRLPHRHAGAQLRVFR